MAKTLEGWVKRNNSTTPRNKRFGIDTLILGGGNLGKQAFYKDHPEKYQTDS